MRDPPPSLFPGDMRGERQGDTGNPCPEVVPTVMPTMQYGKEVTGCQPGPPPLKLSSISLSQHVPLGLQEICSKPELHPPAWERGSLGAVGESVWDPAPAPLANAHVGPRRAGFVAGSCSHLTRVTHFPLPALLRKHSGAAGDRSREQSQPRWWPRAAPQPHSSLARAGLGCFSCCGEQGLGEELPALQDVRVRAD